MDKGFATFFYFGNKKVVLTSITPTPSSSIKNSRSLIAPLFLSLLYLLFSLSSLFFLYLPQRKKCRGNYDHHDHTKDPEHGDQQLC